ncbi:DUF6098 family protein [Crossiella sp. CA-258035]|uniref:DUF6098 family protein n=1 Tax=Crossiella sp. CA-258035 TaxID=2981138 RepID=UPI0024BC08BB|nr:DUF6098 family protein [Crossiella sp. CA-258035]WHT16699.1 DUF6098 family protein [Crossiella sp. CA-258035]
MEAELPTLTSLDELAKVVDERSAELYLRWSKGPDTDQGAVSKDELTGVELPGLSANPLAVEDWWADRPLTVWVARRLYDYRHLRERRGPQVRPWVFQGTEVGRGPDNEPLVRCDRAVAWIAEEVLAEAERTVTEYRADWGPLDRGSR